MHYIIVTGTSRGLGEAIAMKLLKEGNHLFCVSRSKNEALIAKAKEQGVALDYFEQDLNDTAGAELMFEEIFSKMDLERANSVTLFNNAGVLNPIAPIEKYSTDDLIRNINVNLIAPMLASSLFIQHVEGLNCERRIINVSSGAGLKAYYGWSAYCASKAAVNMFTACVAMEQAKRDNPVTILAFAPGVIDTEMQGEIRKSSEEDFAPLKRFIAYHENGDLMPPDFVAKKAITLMTASFENGSFVDVYELD
mgnify:CR=1 FL=1